MIKNKTNSKIVSENARVAVSFSDKIFGMILEKNSQGLIFESRFGIHTFFMKKPIDVLILDKNNRVGQIKKSLKPNRIFLWNPVFSKIIELPEGSLERSGTKKGDILDF